MRTVRPINEAEMVALFLATEYPSPRTHQHILQVLQREGWSPDIIEQPDLRDGQENARRRSILGAYRGYGQNTDYFESLPPEISKPSCTGGCGATFLVVQVFPRQQRCLAKHLLLPLASKKLRRYAQPPRLARRARIPVHRQV